MLPDISNLLERINSAINKKWYNRFPDAVETSGQPDLKNQYTGLIEKNFFSERREVRSREVMENRIEALEQQNDQLLCFMNYLLENLPDLMVNLLHSEMAHLNAFDNPVVLHGGGLEVYDPSCCHNKTDPCPTRREKDVLELLVKGFGAKEIASRLFISETTVITHKKHLKDKFNAKNSVELISKAQPYLTKSKT
jgi:DNA-binding CsgD family transcriptional regulator